MYANVRAKCLRAYLRMGTCERMGMYEKRKTPPPSQQSDEGLYYFTPINPQNYHPTQYLFPPENIILRYYLEQITLPPRLS